MNSEVFCYYLSMEESCVTIPSGEVIGEEVLDSWMGAGGGEETVKRNMDLDLSLLQRKFF